MFILKMENKRCFIFSFIVIPVCSLFAYYILSIKFAGNGTRTPLNEPLKNGDEPIILWWNQMTEGQASYYRTCGSNKCYVTENRLYQKDTRVKKFVFYGPLFQPFDLPLPKLPSHTWALFHDESPISNFIFSHQEMLELFNYTSTFKRQSSYPIPTHLVRSVEWLESKQFMKSVEDKNKYLSELSPVAYIQSHCEVPSGRDKIVQELMKYIKIDSYGKCLHNKDLPKRLEDRTKIEDDELLELLSRYKFVFAAENSICDDYMTEKLWRLLHVGTVPIIIGSPKVQDFLPSNNSAIIVANSKSVKELAEFIQSLLANDRKYETYVEWKQTGITNDFLKNELQNRDYLHHLPKFGFECFLCNKISENKDKSAEKQVAHIADKLHYGCPGPKRNYATNVKGNKRVPYEMMYLMSKYEAKAVKHFVIKNKTVNKEQFYDYVDSISELEHNVR